MKMFADRNRWIASVSSLLLVLSAFSTPAHGQQFALKDGDTVVFYGDSITAQRLYTRFVEEFVLTRYPALNIHFVNAGVPGDTVYGGYAGAMAERVQRDVATFHPAHITVMLGMNDGGYVPKSEKIDAVFQQGYRQLLDALHKAAPGANFTLLTPTPYDEITHGTEFPGYSEVIVKNAEDVAGLGGELQALGEKSLTIVDANRVLTHALETANAKYPQLAPLLIPDRIHPSATGHWIVASTLMSSWHADPIVSRVLINADSVRVMERVRTSIVQLARTENGLKWTQLDEALPLPLDLNNAMTPLLFGVSDIAGNDQLILKIDSLKAGQYELYIDEKPVAEFSNGELQRGVNLALYKTPMLDQARGIDWNEERRATLDEARFILDFELKSSHSSNGADVRLSQSRDELSDTIRTSIAPKPHHFELRRK